MYHQQSGFYHEWNIIRLLVFVFSVEGQQPVQEEHEPRKLALTADEVGDLLKVNTDQVVGLVDKVISKKPIRYSLVSLVNNLTVDIVA